MIILGISAYYHDSAAALVCDGKVVAAAQEERFSRKKHDSRFPKNAIKYCLETAGINLKKVDAVAFYDKPFLKFERLLETYLAFAPRGFQSFQKSIPIWLKEKLFLRSTLCDELSSFGDIHISEKLLFSEHHLSHAASAFFPSPFDQAAVLTLDGVGEWATSSVSIGKGNSLEVIKEIHFPHSLGLLYSAFTYYVGFKVNSGEYKVMGLAPYGEPKYVDLIKSHLIDIKDDGSFRLNMDYFDYCTGLKMTNERFNVLFGGAPRKAESLLTQRDMDLAASVQAVTEEVLCKLASGVAAETGMKNLCLAGGVALNCVANGKVLHEGKFENLWIQPASGDAGGALGAALASYYLYRKQPRVLGGEHDSMQGAYLGPEFTQVDIEKRLLSIGAHFRVFDDTELFNHCAAGLNEGKALGWFQGRMEFGPRALGARSILADARSPSMQSTLNLKIKYRESFRPFAPAVLAEDVSDWFDLDCPSPYMLLVANVKAERRVLLDPGLKNMNEIGDLQVQRSQIPAVTHVDYSARVQTVHHETNPRFHELISKFKDITGCPILVNTSFNIRGEPIVNSPEDAFRCFMGTEIELLAIGNCLLRKEEQDQTLKCNYHDQIEVD